MRDETTHYFAGEGRDFMRDCLARAADACIKFDVKSLVIFSGTGEGPHYAAKEILSQVPYSGLKVVAVTPPFGRAYRSNPGQPDSQVVRAGVNPAMRYELESLGVAVIAAHLPFKEVTVGRSYVSEWTRVSEALGILGGGFPLCIQAILLACDAGFIFPGERVVVASADTALVALASRTESFLSPRDGLLVEHAICRPGRYPVSKREHFMQSKMWGGEAVSRQLPIPQLLEASPPQPPPPATPPATSVAEAPKVLPKRPAARPRASKTKS